MITEDTIRERLAADKKKTSRLATWEEIEYLLDRIAAVRQLAEVALQEGLPVPGDLIIDRLEGR